MIDLDPIARPYLVAAASVLAASVGLTWAMIKVNIADLPNHRSAHQRPTPNAGGVAIASTFCVSLAVLYALGLIPSLDPARFMTFTGLAALVAVVALVDDLRDLSAFTKLVMQVVVAVTFVAAVAYVERLWVPGLGMVEFRFFGPLLTVFWIVGFMNTLNFLDGVNGLASGGTLIASAILGLIAYATGGTLVLLCCVLLFAATLGFFVFNFPAGRIFMGDVGSQFIGFVFAAVAVFGASLEVGRISFYVVPILFYGFIFDFTMTLVFRLLHKKNILEAHREHLFQICNRLGMSHVAVCLVYYLFFLVNGLVAIAAQFSAPWVRLFLVLGLFPIYAIYGIVVYRLALRQGFLQPAARRDDPAP